MAQNRDEWIRELLGKDGNTNDLWIEYWIIQGITPLSFNDMATEWLRGLGFQHSLIDMWFRWEEVELRGTGIAPVATGPFSDGFSNGFKVNL
jgi:hypothetical protein